ncbi:plastid movement impaired 1-related 1 protein [Tanacetum coccineum]
MVLYLTSILMMMMKSGLTSTFCLPQCGTQNKTKASVLEDMETEYLMREWGLNEKAFQRSPSSTSCGSGGPVDLSPEEPLELPPLGGGLRPFMQTIVVPAEMGSGIMDVLQGLASVGIEKLSMQANKPMPLEDLTGKTIQQIT